MKFDTKNWVRSVVYSDLLCCFSRLKRLLFKLNLLEVKWSLIYSELVGGNTRKHVHLVCYVKSFLLDRDKQNSRAWPCMLHNIYYFV